MTYKEAEKLFLTCRDHGSGKLLANNTRLFKRERCYAVRLHSTDVVEIYPDDSCRLYTGGWHTLTTRDRINAFSPTRVWSERGKTRIDGSQFYEGIRVDSKGKVTSKRIDPDKDKKLLGQYERKRER